MIKPVIRTVALGQFTMTSYTKQFTAPQMPRVPNSATVCKIMTSPAKQFTAPQIINISLTHRPQHHTSIKTHGRNRSLWRVGWDLAWVWIENGTRFISILIGCLVICIFIRTYLSVLLQWHWGNRIIANKVVSIDLSASCIKGQDYVSGESK